MRTISFLILFTIYNLLFTFQAHAGSVSLGIDPPIFQISAIPPANIESPLSIENNSDQALNIRIELKPFVPSDREDGQIKYIDEKDANFPDPLILQRVSIINEKGETLKNFKLEVKEKKNLALLINLPKDSPQTDYYFSIVFLSSAEQTANVSSSQTVSGIAANVLLSISAGKVSGEISEFSSPVLLEKGPTQFTLRVKNTSNHFIIPKGEILIKNIFGETLGRVDLQEVNILVNSVRSLDAVWPEKVILGPYKASLSITLSDTGPLFRRNIYFFAFPLKALAALSLGFILLTFLIIKIKSKI